MKFNLTVAGFREHSQLLCFVRERCRKSLCDQAIGVGMLPWTHAVGLNGFCAFSLFNFYFSFSKNTTFPFEEIARKELFLPPILFSLPSPVLSNVLHYCKITEAKIRQPHRDFNKTHFTSIKHQLLSILSMPLSGPKSKCSRHTLGGKKKNPVAVKYFNILQSAVGEKHSRYTSVHLLQPTHIIKSLNTSYGEFCSSGTYL